MKSKSRLPVVSARTVFGRVVRAVQRAYRSNPSWSHIAALYGVSKGTANRVGHGYEPKSPAIRRALRLPIYIRVLACATCGHMHLNPSKVCPTRNRVNRQIRMSISDLPVAVLGWKIRNREEMPDAN